MKYILLYTATTLSLLIFTKSHEFIHPAVWNCNTVASEGNRISDSKSDLSTLSTALGSIPIFKTGTTIVGVCCRDGVVLGADTRSTSGALVMNKNTLKIHPIAPRIHCCGAGTSADCDQLARRTGHELARQRIERDLAGAKYALDPTYAALKYLTSQILNPTTYRRPEAVFILGGVDEKGSSLYQINMDGTSARVSFCALGSGSTHAIAVLESERRKWGCISHDEANSEGEDGGVWEDVDVDDAIQAVRHAVQAGILNDLGSGSHVDLCVITREEKRQWREHLVVRRENDPTAATMSQNTTSTFTNIADTARIEKGHTNDDSDSAGSLGTLLVGTKMKMKGIRMNDSGEVVVEETICDRRRWADGVIVKEIT